MTEGNETPKMEPFTEKTLLSLPIDEQDVLQTLGGSVEGVDSFSLEEELMGTPQERDIFAERYSKAINSLKEKGLIIAEKGDDKVIIKPSAEVVEVMKPYFTEE